VPIKVRSSIFAPVTALSFAQHQEQDCFNFVEKRSANTELVTLSDVDQLTLNAAGMLSDTGYRFNILGFAAVCDAISPGLQRVFNEISGDSTAKLNSADDENYSLPAAVSIYNTALRVRFETLRERHIIVDHHDRIFDGFLGLNHKLLDNFAFIELVQNAQNAQSTPTKFYRAELVGRELRLYIIDPTTRLTTVHPDPRHVFAAGWYCCNREDAGNSVRALPCIYTRFGVALAETKHRARIPHVGTDLVGRTTEMLTRTLQHPVSLEDLKRRIDELTSFKLGFTEKQSELSATIAKWSNYLVSLGLAKPITQHIARNAALSGADIEPRNPLDIYTGKVLEARSGYDLVCAMLKYARNQPTHIREKIQVVGFLLLFPSTKKAFGSF
jgi:hypothetical protein